MTRPSVPSSSVKQVSHVVEAVTDVKPRFTVGEMRELVRRQEAKGFSKAEAMERIRRGEACFVAGTPVATAAGVRPIEEIVTGLEVLSRDMDTGKVEYKPVVQVFRREVTEIIYISITGEPEPIGATTEHPFWTRRARDAIDESDDDEGWRAAGELRVGDLLRRSSGEWVPIAAVERRAERQTVYNVEVAGYHTYFVGVGAVLVHNVCTTPRQGLNLSQPKPLQDAPGYVRFGKPRGGGGNAAARRYAYQVSGGADKAIYVNGVEFDAISQGVLIDAKRAIGPKSFYDISRDDKFTRKVKIPVILKQANRQLHAIRNTEIRGIEWVVADERIAKQLRRLFEQQGLNIDVRFVQALD